MSTGGPDSADPDLPDQDSVERRLRRLEARAAITNLVADYCIGADARDISMFRSVWHPEAIWDVGIAQFHGVEQIEEAISKQWAAQPRMHHWTSNLKIDVGADPDAAQARCDVRAVTVTRESQWLRSAGAYEDRYVVYRGHWLIMSRRATVHWTHPMHSPEGW